jgi:ParB family chromosome partitioning protein
MNRQTLKLSEVIVPERFRKDYGDLTFLKESIKRYGLIQPIVVTQDRVLVGGGRRYASHIELGLDVIDVVYKETLSEADRLEMEALENIARKSFTWQEETLAVARIHRQRSRQAARSGDTWNTRLACELFGVSAGGLTYVLKIAAKLEEELTYPEGRSRPYHAADSCYDAYRTVFLGEQERAVLAELAKRHKQLSATTAPLEDLVLVEREVQQITTVSESVDLLAEERARYESNPLNPPGSFDSYWADKLKRKSDYENTIHISNRFLHSDCIPYMLECPDTFHAIITDIPYGIDMENLNQQNPNGEMRDLDRVIQEHDVAENMLLMERFFPAAFTCTKAQAFVVTYCDIMQWQYMYDLAIKAGFNVQRWPLVWHKPIAMNQCASYNSTKNYEILMVCRKPGTTLKTKLPSSVISATAEDAKKDSGHPFAKPYAITKLLADAISVRGDLLFEPFAGRGSIAIELLRQERRIIATEKQEDHYNALLENVKRFYTKLNPNTVFK